MSKHWLTGVAAIATLIAGTAVAQVSVGTTTSTQSTTTIAPPVASSSTTKTERTIAPDGTEIKAKQSSSTGPGGAAVRSETEVKRPDGSSESTYREQSTTKPQALVPNSSSTTTTTTIGR